MFFHLPLWYRITEKHSSVVCERPCHQLEIFCFLQWRIYGWHCLSTSSIRTCCTNTFPSTSILWFYYSSSLLSFWFSHMRHFYPNWSYHPYPVTGIVRVKHFGEKISFWRWKPLSCRSSHVGCQSCDATHICVLVCKSYFIFSIQFWSLPIPDWFNSVKEFLFIFRQVCQNTKLLLFHLCFWLMYCWFLFVLVKGTK